MHLWMIFPGIPTVSLLLDSGRIHSVQDPTSLKTIFLRSGENASKDFMGEQGQTMQSGGLLEKRIGICWNISKGWG